jgi:CRISPR-associated protein Csd1
MILKALYDLAQQEGLAEDLDFEPAQLRFTFVVGPKGTSATIVDRAQLIPAEGKKRPELRKPTIQIPRRSGRRSNNCSEFLVDKSDYLLGWEGSGKTRPEVLAARRGLYRDLLRQARESLPHASSEREALEALEAFLDQPLEARIQPLKDALDRCASEKDRTELASAFFNVEYAPLGAQPLHLLPGVKAFWKTSRIQSASTSTRCLVTGELCIPVDKHPPLKNVPGGNSAGASLVSFNSPAFESFGAERNDCAPIGREAAEAVSAAVNRLLSRNPVKPDGTALPRRHVRLSVDTVALFWAEGGTDVPWWEKLSEEPEAVEAMLEAPYLGHPPALEDPNAFHTLILSGAQGRCVVRAYGRRTTAEVAQEVRRYLQQVRIPRPYKKGEGVYPLWTYLRSLAVLGKEDNLPPHLASTLYMAILQGAPFPRSVLDAALRRTRAEGPQGESFAARCGLIRAYFHRLPQNPKEIPVSLDPTLQEPGYLLGRLLALLDKLQQDALGSVNATLVDRYYGSASTTPGAVFPTLIRRSQHHLSRLRKDRLGQAVNQEKLLQAICQPLARFPRTLTLDQQGLFALGFHHQRQEFFTPRSESTPN